MILSNTASQPHLRGFTLIEMLVVVVIMSLLAAIAVPSYNRAIAKSERAEAYADLNKIAQAQERYFTVNRNYTNDFGLLNLGTGNSLVSNRATSIYTITLEDASGARSTQDYFLSATPTPSSRNTVQLALSNTGARSQISQEDTTTAVRDWNPGWPE